MRSYIIFLFSLFCIHYSLGRAFSTQDQIENYLQEYKYESSIIMNKMSEVLNDVNKQFKLKGVLKKYSVLESRPIGFFVFDLTDTTNNTESGIVKFKEGHVYHFAPIKKYVSFSNICVLLKGKIIFFKAINCKNKIDDVQQVVLFVKSNIPSISKDIIRRIFEYKRFGSYLVVDNPICKCEW